MKNVVYEYDPEAEIKRLKEELAKQEKRASDCQREITRLRGIGRGFYQAKANLETMNESLLFEAWADFGDEDSPASVTSVIEDHGLGPMDAISFMAYCAGFQKAAGFFKEL
jgi:hypothetical protein